MKHPLGKIKLPLAKDCDLQNLYKQLIETKGQDVKNQIILSHVRMGFSQVLRFTTPNPDELVSVMLDTLVSCVERMAEGALEGQGEITGQRITNYLMFSVRGRLKHFVQTDGLCRVDPATYKKLSQHREVIFMSFGSLDKTRYIDSVENVYDFNELLESIEPTERERRIIDGRLSGQNDEEIGVDCGVSKQAIHRDRLALKDKILRKLSR